MRPISLYTLVNRRQRRKQALFQSLRRRFARVGLGCSAVALLFLMVGLLAGSLFYAGLVKDLPSLDLLPELLDPQHGLLMQPTRLYDRSGQVLLASLENPGVSRRYLYLDPNQKEIFSPELIRASVGAVDPGFWGSPGVNLARLTDPGAATIAERLVSDLLLWNEPPGLFRTLRMRFLAAQVISRFGHVKVLEWYLNSADFGHLAFGADSAARLYLGQPANRLDLAQASLLVAVLQAPALNPLDAPQVALKGRLVVLESLLARKVITKEEYLRAATAAVPRSQSLDNAQSVAGAFTRLVLDRLAEKIDRRRLERGGLRIITTLDYNLQLELACLTRTQMTRLTSPAGSQSGEIRLPDGKPCQSASLLPTLPPGEDPLPKELTAEAIIFEPHSGQILALEGDTTSSGETGGLSPREPGSLLAPVAAVADFARGIGPASLVWDIPSSLPADLSSRQNPDGTFHGPVRLRLALANDYLAPQTQLIDQVGATNVWRLAGAMGLTSLADEKNASLIYEAGQVSLLEIAQAYGVFATQGYRAGQRFTPGGGLKPAVILYVEDASGTAWLDARQPESQSVTSPQLAYLVHHVLSDATARWPSLGYPNPFEIGRPSGAKAGQVAGGRQVWAAGYIPQRVVVFWLGLPAGSKQRLNPKIAAGMWHAAMQYTDRSLPIEDWPEPPGISRVNVCDPSGLLPTGACPEVVREVFLNGSEPSTADNLYQKFQINRETGRLATVFTPAALIDEKVFMVVPPPAKTWAHAAGLPLPPEEYDAIQPPEPIPQVHISSPQLYAFIHGELTIEGSARGDGFRFYQLLVGEGLNPQSWLQIGQNGTEPVSEGTLGTWDTKGQNGLYSLRLLVVRQDQSVELATSQVTVDNTAPLVRVPYPLSNQEIQVPAGGAITFQADASDAIGVQRVVWLVDGAAAGESLTPPYIFSWRAKPGEHELVVKAYDLAGNEGISESVQFRVVTR